MRPSPSCTRKRFSPETDSTGHGLSTRSIGAFHSSLPRNVISTTLFQFSIPPCAATRESIRAAPFSRIAARAWGLVGKAGLADEQALASKARPAIRSKRNDRERAGTIGTSWTVFDSKRRPALYRNFDTTRRVLWRGGCIIMESGAGPGPPPDREGRKPSAPGSPVTHREPAPRRGAPPHGGGADRLPRRPGPARPRGGAVGSPARVRARVPARLGLPRRPAADRP